MTVLRELFGPAGRLEAHVNEPGADGHDTRPDPATRERLRAAVVLHHPHPVYGGTMHTKAVYHAAKALARINCVVLRYNCRGIGQSQGTFDAGVGEMEDFRTALSFMQARYPAVPLWAAGMSFGAWISLTVGAEDPRVSLLLGIAAPVASYDFEAVARSQKPKFFIHGERDEVCPLKDIRSFYARAAEPKELVVIDAADHLFDGKVSEVADAVEDLLGDWPE